MGLWSGSKKVGKFTFVDMPLSIMGINQLKMSGRVLRDLARSSVNPRCPECDGGVLLPYDSEALETQDGLATEVPWRCSRCPFAAIGPKELLPAREAFAAMRTARLLDIMSELELADRLQIARGHRLHSRCYYVASAFSVAGFIYMLASGASLLLAMNWLAIGIMLGVFAMKKSYRAWQVTTGALFQEGAWSHWLRHEKWIT